MTTAQTSPWCCYIPDEQQPNGPGCQQRPTRTIWNLTGDLYDHVDSCDAHVGYLLIDDNEYQVFPLSAFYEVRSEAA